MTGGPLGAGCPYEARFVRRGTDDLIVSLTAGPDQPTSATWGRTLGIVSQATVTVDLSGGVDRACCAALGTLRPWAHELELLRDDELVWRGPLRRPTFTRSRVVLPAVDRAVWLDVRRGRTEHRFVRVDIAQVWARLGNDALAPDRNGLILRPVLTGELVDVAQHAGLAQLVTEQLRSLDRAGVDWTALPGGILVGAIAGDTDPVAKLTDDDFAGDPEAAYDGDIYASTVLVRGEGTTLGSAGHLDPAYGLVERFVDDRTITDQDDADRIARERWLSVGADGPPLVVTTGQAPLTPTAPVSISDLVPGTPFALSLDCGCVMPDAVVRLSALSVTVDRDGERVTPTFEPLGATSRQSRTTGAGSSPPAFRTMPSISGDPVVGGELVLDPGDVVGSPTPDVDVGWERD